MYLSTSSSDRDSSAAVTREHRQPRAGLRVPSAGDQPGSAFVVVEMVILVIVAALAMVAIIVSSGGADKEVHAAAAAAQSRPQTVRDAGNEFFAGPPAGAERPGTAVPSR
ncbi:MAG: hypothetical protein ABI277_16510 [Burkholderiaceae bacterium]